MTTSTSPIAWPAIIKYHGHDELDYIRDQAQWDTEAHRYGLRQETDDRLIDSEGRIYTLFHADHHLVLVATDECARLEDVINLIRIHALRQGACCIAKLSAVSIREAIEIAAD